MGFGCNAAGVVGTRIIDSPREKLIAAITNAFVPCNGKFPTLITLISAFFVGTGLTSGIWAALILLGFVLLGILLTFSSSKLLSATVLKGQLSSFALELPPYRRPQIGRIIVRSIFDRTVFVLGRALVSAAPAGLILWILANTHIGGGSLLSHFATFLNPVGIILGLDGVILMAFILGLPANEIVLPTIVMAYMSGSSLAEYESVAQLQSLFTANGWTPATALCTLLFSMFHWPCATTLLTVKKETGSLKWTLLSAVLPLAFGVALCLLVSGVASIMI